MAPEVLPDDEREVDMAEEAEASLVRCHKGADPLAEAA